MKPSKHTLIIFGVIILALLVVAFWQVLTIEAERAASPTITTSVSLGGPFELVDGDGAVVTEKDFAGQYKLIYFGFTYCPDVCPVELKVMTAAIDMVGQQAGKITPIFISVDPKRDTPGVIKEYVKLFDDRLVGLTGTPQQIEDVKKTFKVYAKKRQTEGTTDYLVDHSSFIYLMGPNNEYITMFKAGSKPQEIAGRLRQIVK